MRDEIKRLAMGEEIGPSSAPLEPVADGETLLLRRFAAVQAGFMDRSCGMADAGAELPADVSTSSTSPGGDAAGSQGFL